ncbi:hypothetical protein GCM10022393_26960 [Aquimarina addita]|uniref:SH3b domain-containing protein n=1 Tax=Aquimarina addita TaxID=870485 RepID=A0ABP6UP08_9FLAO
MNLPRKLFLTFSCIVFFIKCDKKETKIENKLLSNDEASIIREAEIKIKKTLDVDLLSSKGISIMSNHIVTFDFDYDNSLDALVFCGFKNTQDHSFHKSKVIFLRNNGKELIPTDSLIYSDKYIIPSQSKTFYSARGDGVIIEKYIPDAYGRIGEAFNSRGIVIYLENTLYLDYISTNDIDFSYSETDYIQYVSARKGLLCRDQPGKKGKVIHKLNYGEEVNVIKRTNQELTIYDEDKNESITGDWVAIKLNTLNTYAKEGYVFNGYLVDDNPN